MRTAAVALGFVALVVGAPANTAASPTSGSDAGTCRGAYVIAVNDATRQRASDAVLCLVNNERTARGLPAVRASAQLASAALTHSDDMVARKVFSHAGRGGDGVTQRVSRTGYAWRAVAETLAWGAAQRATPFRLVAALMQSGEHRPILLDRHYREAGVGLAFGAPRRKVRGAAVTLTVVFGSR